MRYLTLILSSFFLLSTYSPAEARRIPINSKIEVNHLVDIKSKGPNGEEFYLGYATEKTYVLAEFLSFWLSDEGYALGRKGQNEKYIPLNDNLKTKLLATGAFPDGLPPYSVSASKYFFGFMGWFLIGGLIFLSILWKRITKG